MTEPSRRTPATDRGSRTSRGGDARGAVQPLVRVGRVVDRRGSIDPEHIDPEATLQVTLGGSVFELNGARLWAYLLSPADPGNSRGGWGTADDLDVTLSTYLPGPVDGDAVDSLADDGLLVPVTGDPEVVLRFARQHRITPYAEGLGSLDREGVAYQWLGYDVGSSEAEAIVDLVAQVVFAAPCHRDLLGATQHALAVAAACQRPTVDVERLLSAVVAQSAAGTFAGLWALEPVRDEHEEAGA